MRPTPRGDSCARVAPSAPAPAHAVAAMPSPYRLVAFDMDGTLIQQEVIDEIARVRGVEGAVSVWCPVLGGARLPSSPNSQLQFLHCPIAQLLEATAHG